MLENLTKSPEQGESKRSQKFITFASSEPNNQVQNVGRNKTDTVEVDETLENVFFVNKFLAFTLV